MGPKWFRFISWLLDYPFRGSIAGLGVLFAYFFANIVAVLQVSGAPGSLRLLLVLVIASSTAIATVALVSRALRWALVYAAVRQFTCEKLWGKEITSDTVLVGGSGGGGIAVGMVAKAIQEKYERAPRVAVIDQDYVTDQFDPATATLVFLREELRHEHVLYVTTYIGTGRSKQAMLRALGIEGCKTFAFVVDDAARDSADFYLVRGKRHVVPWPR